MIGERAIGPGCPVYIVAEMSANHLGRYDRAAAIVQAAAKAGADAVKLQTYTADSLTIDSSLPWFSLGAGSPWAGRTLYDLYKEAATPWDWQPRLMKLAGDLGLQCFSTPFDEAAVDFLEQLNVPAYKVASFELGHLPLLRRIAQTGKSVILSTGLATLDEVDEAIAALRDAGTKDCILLKCTSGYPAQPEEMNLRAIPFMAERYGAPVGLSDHTLSDTASLAAVALGACIIEKHLTLNRTDGGPDAAFSVEPEELARLVRAVRETTLALGRPVLEPGRRELANRQLRRSVFAVADIPAGAEFTADNIRIIRPGDGLPPRFYDQILGKRAVRPIPRGTPLQWTDVG